MTIQEALKTWESQERGGAGLHPYISVDSDFRLKREPNFYMRDEGVLGLTLWDFFADDWEVKP